MGKCILLKHKIQNLDGHTHTIETNIQNLDGQTHTSEI
jgi:hypothetical protein